ncbi:MAG TPA: hypothetical protein VFQ51_13425, partial [Vicinamibacteria bacterium]|nr:hypothetical protein [Vicinamibacteria bacterium]
MCWGKEDPWAAPPTTADPQSPLPMLSAADWTDVFFDVGRAVKGLADQLGVTEAVEDAVRSLAARYALQQRIDKYFADAAASYAVGGTVVQVEPFFRRSKGWAPPDGTASPRDLEKRVLKATGRHDKAFQHSVHMCAWGRGSPEDVRVVTQALLDAGKLDEVLERKKELSDDEFQRLHGVS